MLKLFEMFAGYGGASFSLKKLGVKFETIGYSEIDKYAIKCYEQNHKGKNYGDCRNINPHELPNFDLLTGGFPCQSFSAAGKGFGELDPRGTLVYDIIRIAEVKQPKYMLLENVKGFTFKKFKPTFNKVLKELDRIGYTVYWKVLNTKDYGIPQNRERVYFVCFRKDLPQAQFNGFKFPIEKELKLFISDILEDNVDKKYHLNQKQIRRLFKKERIVNERLINKLYTPTLLARDYKDPKVIIDSKYYKDNLQANVIEMDNKVITHNLQKRSFNRPSIQKAIKEGKSIPGGYGHLSKNDNTSYCLDTGNTQAIEYNSKIRKLTPKECFRLMGFLNDEIKLDGLSDTQKYKLAGNGWDINLVSLILKNMFRGDDNI